MIQIAICDDDAVMLTEMQSVITQHMEQKNLNYQLYSYQNGEALLLGTEDAGMFHIVFLDIELTRMDGILVAGILREKYPSIILVFISAYSEYYKAAFDVQPFQFLDKPVAADRLLLTLDQVLERVVNDTELLTFCQNRVYYSIKIGDIVYLESNKRMITAFCTSGTYEFYDKLEHLEEYLGTRQQRFVRIHRSFLVNTNHIRTISYTCVGMSNGVELMISRDKRSRVREYYTKWLEGMNF